MHHLGATLLTLCRTKVTGLFTPYAIANQTHIRGSYRDLSRVLIYPSPPCLQFLRDQGLYESEAERVLREDVLGQLGQMAQQWVAHLSDAHGYGADGALARIYTFGSFRLGVHGPGAPPPWSLHPSTGFLYPSALLSVGEHGTVML